MIGFVREAENYFIFVAITVLLSNVGCAMGLLLGVLASDASVAVALVPVTILPFMLFSGFFLNSKNVPPYFIWIEYISFVKYGFRAVVLNEVNFNINLLKSNSKILVQRFKISLLRFR